MGKEMHYRAQLGQSGDIAFGKLLAITVDVATHLSKVFTSPRDGTSIDSTVFAD